ncbi:methylthioribose kinase [Bacillus cytotoxicus]|uniref:Methylthioribose kinase n=1 Tax=Bacillus cytotoxicus TaxID=580165 RepID=A0ACC6A827_9BACI|nr:methylthioribose kinase [Bacillus cytotoxicus]HDX9576601.1 methylthioribose kinase [Bacillus pseudomycoides]
MIQRFIELGEGYSDLYELLEIAKANKHRVSHMLQFNTSKNDKAVCSLVVVLQPTTVGDFQPLYICREGIPVLTDKKSKRITLFEETAEQIGKKVVSFTVKPSTTFPENELYFNHLIGILRMNNFIPPMR